MVKVLIFSIVIFMALLDMSSALQRNTLFPRRKFDKRIVAAYFNTFKENYGSEGRPTNLRNLPPYVNTVFISYAKPDMNYAKGSYYAGYGSQTGLVLPYDGKNFAESIVSLKRKNITVILSIGGVWLWTHRNAYNINYQQIKDFVDDFAFDGIEWNYQGGGSDNPANVQPGSTNVLSEKFHVDKYIEFITKTRKVMPKNQGYLVGCSPSGIGAFGVKPIAGKNTYNDWNSRYNWLSGAYKPFINHGATGHFIPVMLAVGSQIDLITYQSWNVGLTDYRKIMYEAYAHYGNIYGFKIAAGFLVPNDRWTTGERTYDRSKTIEITHNFMADFAAYIKSGGNIRSNAAKRPFDGIMVSDVTTAGRKLCIINYLILIQGESVGNSLNAAGKNLDAGELYDGKSSYKDLITRFLYCGYEAYENTKQYPAHTTIYYGPNWEGSLYKSKWAVRAWDTPGTMVSHMWQWTKKCPYAEHKNTEGRPDYLYNPFGKIAIKIDVQTGKWAYTQCGAVKWDANTLYPSNSEVIYRSDIWKSLSQQRGQPPVAGGQWEALGTCDQAGGLKPSCGNVKPWDSSKTYPMGGNVCFYKGIIYKNWYYARKGNTPPTLWSGWYEIGKCSNVATTVNGVSYQIRGAGANEDIAHSDDNSGSIIPIVIPVLVVLTLVLAALGFYYQRRKESKEVNLQNFESELV